MNNDERNKIADLIDFEIRYRTIDTLWNPFRASIQFKVNRDIERHIWHKLNQYDFKTLEFYDQ